MDYYAYVKTEGFELDKVRRTDNIGMDCQHYHDTYEVMVIEEGTRSLVFNNVVENVAKGDIIVFTPYVLHLTRPYEETVYCRYCLNFSTDVLTGIMSPADAKKLVNGLRTGIIRTSESNIGFIKAMLDNMLGNVEVKTTLDKAMRAVRLASFIELLAKLTVRGQQRKQPDITCSEQFMHILNYVNSNYTKPITLDDAAREAHLSKTHFCRMFKKETGMTFMEHLTGLRIARAHDLLVCTDEPIQSIAESAGFSSLLSFERLFKSALGKSPQAVRHDNAQKRL